MLEEAAPKCGCSMCECCTNLRREFWMQALVRIVVEQMGGSASAGELAQRCWDHMQQLKYRQETSHRRTASSALPKKVKAE